MRGKAKRFTSRHCRDLFVDQFLSYPAVFCPYGGYERKENPPCQVPGTEQVFFTTRSIIHVLHAFCVRGRQQIIDQRGTVQYNPRVGGYLLPILFRSFAVSLVRKQMFPSRLTLKRANHQRIRETVDSCNVNVTSVSVQYPWLFHSFRRLF